MSDDLTTNIDSILWSIKKDIGLLREYTQFDADLIMHTNSTFGILNQLGVGPEKPFMITGYDECWSDFIKQENTEFVRSYVYLKVKMLFDPPSTATMHEAFERSIQEIEWRLTIAADPLDYKKQEDD